MEVEVLFSEKEVYILKIDKNAIVMMTTHGFRLCKTARKKDNFKVGTYIWMIPDPREVAVEAGSYVANELLKWYETNIGILE